jgi:hypothetical protein
MNSNPPKKQPTAINEPQEDQIRLRAYELFQERGCQDSHDEEDWFRAKEEITSKKYRTASA